MSARAGDWPSARRPLPTPPPGPPAMRSGHRHAKNPAASRLLWRVLSSSLLQSIRHHHKRIVRPSEQHLSGLHQKICSTKNGLRARFWQSLTVFCREKLRSWVTRLLILDISTHPDTLIKCRSCPNGVLMVARPSLMAASNNDDKSQLFQTRGLFPLSSLGCPLGTSKTLSVFCKTRRDSTRIWAFISASIPWACGT
jgi:hypothetical protein